MKHQLSKKRIYRNTCRMLARWSMEILVFSNECVSHVYVMLRHMENDEGNFDISCKLKKYLLNKVIW